MRLRVHWTVVEDHSAEIEVDDDFDPEHDLTDEIVAEQEDARSYLRTTDRTIESWVPVT
jgi:hypothetical protein